MRSNNLMRHNKTHVDFYSMNEEEARVALKAYRERERREQELLKQMEDIIPTEQEIIKIEKEILKIAQMEDIPTHC